MYKKVRIIVTILIFGATLLCVQNANAIVILDSGQEEWIGSTYFGDSDGREFLQSFTIKNSGTLAYIDLLLWDYGSSAIADAVLEIIPVGADFPYSPYVDHSMAIASAAVSPTLIPDYFSFVRFDFRSSNIQVQSGDELAFLASTLAVYPNGYTLGTKGSSSEDPYPGGSLYLSLTALNSTPWEPVTLNTFYESTFKIYIDDGTIPPEPPNPPVQTPEPTSMLLLGLGLAGLAGVRRELEGKK